LKLNTHNNMSGEDSNNSITDEESDLGDS
jgi:hypothetical protein